MRRPNKPNTAWPIATGRRRGRTGVSPRQGVSPCEGASLRKGASLREAAAFSLIEIMVALVVVAIVLAVAVPVYQVHSVRAYRTQAQADLLRCAQGMERHAAFAMGYGEAVDVDGDGRGDQSTGQVSANVCTVASVHYRVTVHAADATHFVLRAEASAASPVAGDGVLELDAAGERRWDRNDDGDFGDDGERRWD